MGRIIWKPGAVTHTRDESGGFEQGRNSGFMYIFLREKTSKFGARFNVKYEGEKRNQGWL